jgi:hypothetical protein
MNQDEYISDLESQNEQLREKLTIAETTAQEAYDLSIRLSTKLKAANRKISDLESRGKYTKEFENNLKYSIEDIISTDKFLKKTKKGRYDKL